MSHLEAICIPTQPYEIRVAVASELPRLWSAILSSSHVREVVHTCCQLVLNLLQDSDIDVRSCMAVSVAKMLPGSYIKFVKVVELLHNLRTLLLIRTPSMVPITQRGVQNHPWKHTSQLIMTLFIIILWPLIVEEFH